jgi:hypothetical protein
VAVQKWLLSVWRGQIGVVASLVTARLNDECLHMGQEKIVREIKEVKEGSASLTRALLLLLCSLPFTLFCWGHSCLWSFHERGLVCEFVMIGGLVYVWEDGLRIESA